MTTETLQDRRAKLCAVLATTVAQRRLSGLDSVRQRLSHVRDCAGLSQGVMASWLGIALKSWQNYERGNRSPNTRTLTALWQLGINPTWILTGTESVLVNAPRPVGELDRERMATAIEATAEGLKRIQRTLSPALYAQLALAAYDLMDGEC